MKTYVTKNANYPNGVCLTIESDNGIEMLGVEISKDGLSYKLPENPSGRVWLTVAKFEKNDGYVELNAINRNQPANIVRKKEKLSFEALEQFLEEGEQEMWFALKDALITRYNEAKANEAKEAEIAKKKAKAMAEIERLTKELEELEA
jgi:hypothetical protein